MFAGQKEFVKVSSSQVGDNDQFNSIGKDNHALCPDEFPGDKVCTTGPSSCGRPSMLNCYPYLLLQPGYTFKSLFSVFLKPLKHIAKILSTSLCLIHQILRLLPTQLIIPFKILCISRPSRPRHKRRLEPFMQ